MPTTSNFGWTTPADTDLVKDGAAAIRTLGNGIDTSFVDLKGGTTGQILTKNTNTDLDFTWTTGVNAIAQSIVDAKGDLITATADDTPARLGVGSNDQVLTADSTTATGLKWATPASGGMTQLASGSLSSTATNITSISGSYRDLRLVLSGFYFSLPGSMTMRFNNVSTSSYGNQQGTLSGSNTTFGSTSLTLLADVSDSAATNAMSIINVFEYANTSRWKHMQAFTWGNDSGNNGNMDFNVNNGGFYNGTAAITEINIIANGGGTMSGSYVLYGVK